MQRISPSPNQLDHGQHSAQMPTTLFGNRSLARCRNGQVLGLGANSWHQPLGLMSPSTNLHAFGG